MKSKETNKSSVAELFSKIVRRQIFIPIAALLLLAIFNLVTDPSFYRSHLVITVRAILYYPDI